MFNVNFEFLQLGIDTKISCFIANIGLNFFLSVWIIICLFNLLVDKIQITLAFSNDMMNLDQWHSRMIYISARVINAHE